MAQHPSSVRLPWAIDLIGTMRPIPLSWRAIALIHEFTDTGGNGPILTVYDHFDPLVNWKIHTRYVNLGIGINHFKAVVLRVRVDNVAPAIDANNRNDPIVFVWVGVNLLQEGIQTVLLSHDHQSHHLLIGRLRMPFSLSEGNSLQGIEELVWINPKTRAEAAHQC